MDDDHSSIIQTQTIIALTKAVTARAIAQCLMFLYTGTIEKEFLKIDVSILCIDHHVDIGRTYFNFFNTAYFG